MISINLLVSSDLNPLRAGSIPCCTYLPFCNLEYIYVYMCVCMCVNIRTALVWSMFGRLLFEFYYPSRNSY